MKKKLVKWMLFTAVAFMVNAANAQDAKTPPQKFTPEQKAERMTAHLKQKLSLNDEQAQKVKAVYLDHLQKMDKGNAQRKEAHHELESSLSKILSQDQLATYKTMEAERREQMKTRKNQQIQPSPDKDTMQDTNRQDQK
jgi:hypothetical protein